MTDKEPTKPNTDPNITAEIKPVTIPRISPVRRLAVWTMPFAAAATGAYLALAITSRPGWAAVMDLVRPLAIVGMALAAGCLAADHAAAIMLDQITARIDRNLSAARDGDARLIEELARFISIHQANLAQLVASNGAHQEFVRRELAREHGRLLAIGAALEKRADEIDAAVVELGVIRLNSRRNSPTHN